jgi:hypothetical protein
VKRLAESADTIWHLSVSQAHRVRAILNLNCNQRRCASAANQLIAAPKK